MTPFQSGCLTAFLKTALICLVGIAILCGVCSLGSCVGVVSQMPRVEQSQP